MPKSKRWFITSGLCLILTGLWQIWEGWTSLRISIEADGLAALGGRGFLVFLGFCFIGVALGLVKLRGGRQ
jgi:hypothetical protein